MAKTPCKVSSVSGGSEYEPEKNLSGGNFIAEIIGIMSLKLNLRGTESF